MGKLIDEVRYDLVFLRSHTLQPKWWKILKVFILPVFPAGYAWLFGFVRAALFSAAFVSLCLVIHFAYRAGTHKYTRSRLDFAVAEMDRRGKPKRIGKYYYPAVLISAALAFLISRLLL